MLTCPKCQTGIPEGMRFCLQCGVPLAPPPTALSPRVDIDPPMLVARVADLPVPADPVPPAVATARPPRNMSSTVSLKISPTPVMSPRTALAVEHPRPSLGGPLVDVDEELLKKCYERQTVQPGTVVCRFCRGPLDIAGDFCEQCGAPVEEAAPPGVIPPKPPPAPPALLDPGPVPSPSVPAPAAPSLRSGNPNGSHRNVTPLPVARPATNAEPIHLTPARTPAPFSPAPRPTTHAEEPPSGLVGRLKGLFKKG